ncbi:PP2C family protein-serine/threonine phosphatase [Actinophytocola algeriensis]|uniref:Serine phosphatase RsbU (Regulator of sigma subunit) n=1 Tax=Actinophytocola algeriensis TaxID=1768010 RepID=A0A7W7Q7G8_9PSEU|nr:PP2C family protein-serine/threonine phosphatase [Actinophytocola algeriensis]MBB4908409.1 serine phosphatase RsbU (regulator of sigma subunit) [Actinophytocola algeriensis]MBE1475204.1 serine phosphatase RsbU (regulator of sigma subunit) [Actinophytocola algeriensis]
MLIVADEAAGTTQLPGLAPALSDGGFDVRTATEDEVLASDEPDGPDGLLVSASLGLQRVAMLARRFAHLPAPPTTIVFPQDDLDALEACVRGGFDYIMPPFLPSLLRSRMSSCWERGQLAGAVEDMAAEASLRAYERDLAIAHEIQSGFLPEKLPAPHGWDVASRFRPARQVAGDFYDGFELVDGRRLGFVVADVCDKGVGAALFMALIRTLLRHTAEHTGTASGSGDDLPPAPGSMNMAEAGASLSPMLSVGAGPLVQAVVATNRYLTRNHLRQGYFATLIFGVLDPASGALLYINGGHNPAVLQRADGSHTLLPPTGPAVGMMLHSSYALGHASLERGDTLLLYTDGVVEARATGGTLFGMERLLTALSGPVKSAETVLSGIDKALRVHVGGAEQSDDITMLALHRSAV